MFYFLLMNWFICLDYFNWFVFNSIFPYQVHKLAYFQLPIILKLLFICLTQINLIPCTITNPFPTKDNPKTSTKTSILPKTTTMNLLTSPTITLNLVSFKTPISQTRKIQNFLGKASSGILTTRWTFLIKTSWKITKKFASWITRSPNLISSRANSKSSLKNNKNSYKKDSNSKKSSKTMNTSNSK